MKQFFKKRKTWKNKSIQYSVTFGRPISYCHMPIYKRSSSYLMINDIDEDKWDQFKSFKHRICFWGVWMWNENCPLWRALYKCVQYINVMVTRDKHLFYLTLHSHDFYLLDVFFYTWILYYIYPYLMLHSPNFSFMFNKLAIFTKYYFA